MNPFWAIMIYSASIALALLLYFFPVRWYWHAVSLMTALALGLAPIPPGWTSPRADLAIGFVFVFLLVWGLAEPLFTFGHHHRHGRPHHA